MPISEVYNMDCMEYMKGIPDKFFDLAIVDPQYGIDIMHKGGMPKHLGFKQYKRKDWDKSPPGKKYFEELFRVSKNQIIFGGNYFTTYLPPKMGWIVWDKDNGNNDFADCELAWTSFSTAVRKIKYRWHGMLQQNMKHKENRIHPTQKPVALYEWLLNSYAKPGDIILDTHVGSASSLIACYRTNHPYVGFELDKHYYDLSKKRLDAEMAQMRLSDFMPEVMP